MAIRLVYSTGNVAASTASSLSVTVPAEYMVPNHAVIVAHCNDFGTASTMGTPSGSTTGWALIATADSGTNEPHCKVWLSNVANINQNFTVTVSNGGNYACSLHVLIVTRQRVDSDFNSWLNIPSASWQGSTNSNSTSYGVSSPGQAVAWRDFLGIVAFSHKPAANFTSVPAPWTVVEYRAGQYMSGGIAIGHQYPSGSGSANLTGTFSKQAAAYARVNFSMPGDAPTYHPSVRTMSHFPT